MDATMQILALTFLALLLAHLLADFPLQSNWIVWNKSRRLSALVSHGLIHWSVAWGCLLLFASARFLSWRAHLVVGAYFAAHLLIDKLKYWLTAKKVWRDDARTFSIDQVLHVLTIAIASLLLSGINPLVLPQTLALSPSAKMHALEIATVYLGVVVSGGYLIRYLTKSFRGAIDDEASSSGSAAETELKNAGLYIGYLERLLILTAILAKSATLVGLILTGKSIARFPELRKPSFAEYFLIGTLLSVSLAVLGGLLLQEMLYGSIAFR
jgi:hypothetical protein